MTFAQAVKQTTLFGTKITNPAWPFGHYFSFSKFGLIKRDHTGENPCTSDDFAEWCKLTGFQTLDERNVATAWFHEIYGTDDPAPAPEVWF